MPYNTYYPNALILKASEIPNLSWEVFQSEVVKYLRNHRRLISFFASPGSQASSVYLNAVLLKKAHGFVHLRTEMDAKGSFQTFTHEFPFFHCFEREIFEQFGLKPTGHPWLKPIRYSGAGQGQMSTYPFFKMEGKEIHEVGVGPIHAGVIEPGHFRFMCYGETVHHLEIQLGYQHRALEIMLLKKDPLKLAPLIETAAGDSSIAHTWAYCQALELMAGFTPSAEVDLIRAIALELERIAMHLVGLAGISTDIAFLPGSSTYGRLRTSIINTLMRICGSRFGRAWLRPGGVQHGLNTETCHDVIKTLEDFYKDFKIINKLFLNSYTVKHRLKNTGVISKQLAFDLGLVGTAARASGKKIDLRSNLVMSPLRAYRIRPITKISGGCWARSLVRINEIKESTKFILSILKARPTGLSRPSATPSLPGPLGPGLISMSAIEGFRGEVFHYLETDGHGRLKHYKVQDPSLRNWFGLAQAVRNTPISDFPICNKSFDLSYCGNDL